MRKNLKSGDAVTWITPQGKTSGIVKKKLTAPMKIKGHQVKASLTQPQYLVASTKSGKPAAHKRNALTKTTKP